MLSRFSHVRLCDPMDCSPPGSSVHGILQARVLEWVATPSSRGSSQPCVEKIKTVSSASPPLQVDSLLLSDQGSPVCSFLSLTVCSSLTLMQELQSESERHSVVSDSLRPHDLYSPWTCLGQNAGVGSLSLLQRIFPTQGSNSGLLHCRQILYQLSHKGSHNTNVSQSVVLRLIGSTSPGNLSEKQIPRSHPDMLSQKLWVWGPTVCSHCLIRNPVR